MYLEVLNLTDAEALLEKLEACTHQVSAYRFEWISYHIISYNYGNGMRKLWQNFFGACQFMF